MKIFIISLFIITSGLCCTSDLNCPWNSTPFCSAGFCRNCLSSSECVSHTPRVYCDADGSCVQCSNNYPCPSGLVCDLTQSICVECLEDSHCTIFPTKMLCDTTSKVCVQCNSNAHCPTNYYCSSYLCEICTATLFLNGTCEDFCGNGVRTSILEECDDGNTMNNDGCSSSCKIEPGWACSQNSSSSSDNCTLYLSMEIQYVHDNTLKITFNNTIPISPQSDRGISVILSDIDPEEYSLEFYIELNEIYITIDIPNRLSSYDVTATINVTNSTIIFNTTNIIFLENSKEITFKLSEPKQYESAIATLVGQAGQALVIAAAATSVGGLASGGSELFQFMSGLELLLILNFLNVNFPSNLKTLLEMSLINVGWTISPFKSSVDSTTLNTPEKFVKAGYNHTFLKGNGGYLFLFAISGLVHWLVSKFLHKFSEKCQRTLLSLKKKFGLRKAFKLLMSNSILFFIPAVLELRDSQFGSLYRNISWLCAIFTFIGYAYIIRTTHTTLENIRKLEPEARKEKFKMKKFLYVGYLNAERTDASPFLATTLLYNSLQILFIVGFYNVPSLQIGSLVILDLIYLRLLVSQKPYTNPSTQRFMTKIQVLLLTIKSLILVFYVSLNEEDPDEEYMRFQFGWVIGGLASFYLAIFQYRALSETLPRYKKLLQHLCKRKKAISPDKAPQDTPVTSNPNNSVSEESSKVQEKEPTPTETQLNQHLQSPPVKSQVDLDITDPELDNSYAKLNKDKSYPELQRSETVKSLEPSQLRKSKIYTFSRVSLDISNELKSQGVLPKFENT